MAENTSTNEQNLLTEEVKKDNNVLKQNDITNIIFEIRGTN